MNPELENLMNMALADGDITDKKRAIILKKAEALGEDKDEIEMILDGKIALMKKEQHYNIQRTPQKSNKEGELKKCPSCGTHVDSFTSKCKECGHEYRNTESSKSVSELFNSLQKVAEEIRKEREIAGKDFKSPWGSGILSPSDPQVVGNAIATAQTSIISSFPIPNNKEDIIEFLSLGMGQAKIKISKLPVSGITHPMDKGKEQLKFAWKAKCEQVIIKARFSMKDNKQTQLEIEEYTKQLLELDNQEKGLIGGLAGSILNIFNKKW